MGDAAIEALRTVVQVADNEALVQARNDLVDAQNKIAALERKVVSRFRKEAFQYAHVVLQEANAMLPQAGVLYQHTISHKIEVNGAQEADLFVSPPSQGTDPQESYIMIEREWWRPALSYVQPCSIGGFCEQVSATLQLVHGEGHVV